MKETISFQPGSAMTRRSMLATLGAAALTVPVVNVALADEGAPKLTDSESGTKTVEGGEVDHKELYGATAREAIDLGATTEELDELLDDEPVVTEDLVLPDGTVVDKAYVALRNKLNRMSEGIANDPVENSYEMVMRLWTPEEAAQEVLAPSLKWFNSFDYIRRARKFGVEYTREEAEAILDNLCDKRLVTRNLRAGTKWYWLHAWIDGIWETHIPEVGEDLSFVNIGVSGSDYGTGSSFPILHVCPVDASVVEGGVIDELRDWRLIVDSTDSYGIGECICRLAAKTRGDAEMNGFAREHTWNGEDGEGFIKTCMVFGEYADWFIEEGLAERVTKEEMIANIETAIEDGFVPEMYWGEHPGIACMCKSDMCDCLTSYRRVNGNTSNFPKVSGYVLDYDGDACVKCGACIDRCPMKAISFGDDGLCVMENCCVACGQCAMVCPASARILKKKEDIVEKMPFDYIDDLKWRAEDRMQKGYIRDFVGTSLDDNQADNDFAAKLEKHRAAKA